VTEQRDESNVAQIPDRAPELRARVERLEAFVKELWEAAEEVLISLELTRDLYYAIELVRERAESWERRSS
jgi:hypothetical protein